VLSDETADTDHGAKREEYARLASIRRYVLLEQDRVAVIVLTMTPGGWAEGHMTDGVLGLPEIGVALPLEHLYRGPRLG
jgi:Uma2 family endonuclease